MREVKEILGVVGAKIYELASTRKCPTRKENLSMKLVMM
ncbi:hypothetical protein M7I_0356 [Glarea lozoyensis 74030]|uniref:Uncharacterized protein n=1 Tax=Glarea lozoyensis (strain ATCC 74030 / MF5533) TaxID=1104152 RepID=H0ED55_GLAL7|nr:hypothetical protein M7I_0356 [Glarea lozoyensis 74030]